MTTATITRPNLFTSVGKDVSSCRTGAEALAKAGLGWNVSARELFHAPPPQNDSMREVPTHRAFVRDDNERVMSVLTKDFTPIQNDKVLEFFDPFLEAGEASFECAGELRGGKTVFAIAKLNRAPIVVGKEDTVNKYLMAANSHDGSMALRVQFLPFRTVCSNILNRFTRGSRLLRIVHSKQIQQRLDQVQTIVNAADGEFQATAEQYKALAKRGVRKQDLEKFVKLVFEPHNADEQRKLLAVEKMTETITRLFETGAGSELKTANGTLWGLYNATTEYLTHERGKTDDRRLYSACFYENARIGAKAFKVAMEMVSQ